MVSSIIIAAKIEQPLTPSIRMTIKFLPEEEKKFVSKDLVVAYESDILSALSFNFNFLSP